MNIAIKLCKIRRRISPTYFADERSTSVKLQNERRETKGGEEIRSVTLTFFFSLRNLLLLRKMHCFRTKRFRTFVKVKYVAFFRFNRKIPNDELSVRTNNRILRRISTPGITAARTQDALFHLLLHYMHYAREDPSGPRRRHRRRGRCRPHSVLPRVIFRVNRNRRTRYSSFRIATNYRWNANHLDWWLTSGARAFPRVMKQLFGYFILPPEGVLHKEILHFRIFLPCI